MPQSQIESYIKEYLDYLEVEKNRSPKTVENYRRYLSAFIKATGAKNLKDINPDTIRQFRLSLSRKPGKSSEYLKKSTQSYYAIAIRNFLKYLVKNNIKVSVLPEQIELPKIPQRQIEIIDYPDFERFLNGPQ